MSYVYEAYVQYKDDNGRFADLSNTPTITAFNRDNVVIPGATLTPLRTGRYRCFVTHSEFEVVLFEVIPHVDDQANFEDVVVMHDTVDGARAVWEYFDRTLTQSAQSVIAAVTGSSITQVRGDTWDITLTGLTLDENLIQFAIKRKKSDADKHALVFMDNKTGLLYLNGEKATANKRSLEYQGTSLRIRLAASEAAKLDDGKFPYGIQSISADETVLEPYAGDFILLPDTVRTVSGGE